jgi:hypothetical protein
MSCLLFVCIRDEGRINSVDPAGHFWKMKNQTVKTVYFLFY